MIRNLHTKILRNYAVRSITANSLKAYPTTNASLRLRYNYRTLTTESGVSQEPLKDQQQNLQDKETSEALEESSTPDSTEDVPWYLRSENEDTEQLNPSLKEPIPETPEGSPESLKNVVEYLIRDLGLKDVSFIDLRNRDPVTIFGPDAIMIIATGKNDRHIGKAAQELMTWVKRNYDVVPYREGIYTAGYIKIQKRRQKKKSRKLARADDSYESFDNRFVNDWVTMDMKMDGLLVQLFTEDKRDLIDLEYVWSENKKEMRALRQKQREEKLKKEEEEYFQMYAAQQEQDDLDLSTYDVEYHESAHQPTTSSPTSPFSDIKGSTREMHTLRNLRSSFRTLNISRSYSTTTSNNSINTSRDISEGISQQETIQNKTQETSSSSSAKTALDKLKFFLIFGDFKNSLETYRQNFSQFSSSSSSLPFENDSEAVSKLQNEANLLVLKTHINYLTKIEQQLENSSEQDESTNKVSTTLNKNSNVIHSFVNSFPYFPTREHWKLRLHFFQKAHKINPIDFPLEMLHDMLISQQSSGLVVTEPDIIFVINTIVHSNQYTHPQYTLSSIEQQELKKLNNDGEKLGFEQISLLKSKLIYSILENCLRPQMSPATDIHTINDSILMLIYRLWVNDQAPDFISPKSALEDCQPRGIEERLKRLERSGSGSGSITRTTENANNRVLNERSRGIFRYFSDRIKANKPLLHNTTTSRAAVGRSKNASNEQPSIISSLTLDRQITVSQSFFVLSLTAFANDLMWKDFWILWDKIVMQYHVDTGLLNLMASLVTRTGDRSAILFLLNTAFNKVLMIDEDLADQKTIEIVQTALQYVDPTKSEFAGLRKYIDTFQQNTTS